ncbi:LamG-like jellyroll fold domain-containing protein [Acetivibrio cellulolyticus]|uniref:LamG-like jellyroll fold domain-containing protein n=1 Tax=Acetivibrio cellulolyticus TaxID=35830 RepID=UPI0001E2CC3D|nr:LamG-like jellyroll fold domain-containing protein [Acetivibrio cellulolyticus]
MIEGKKEQHKNKRRNYAKYNLMALVIIMVSMFLASTVQARENNWILQGELKNSPVIKVASGSATPQLCYYFNTGGNLVAYAYIPVNNAPSVPFTEIISWGSAFEGGAEYKLVWKARSVTGTASIDGHALPLGTWSDEYETKGRTLVWTGATSNTIEFEYVKLYARDSFFSEYEVTAQWDFKGGLANDTTGNGNNGTYVGNVQPNIPGKTGQGLGLEANSYMTVPASSSLYFGDQDFSISFWYKMATSSTGMYTLINNTNTVDGKTSGYEMVANGSTLIACLYVDGKAGTVYGSDVMKYDGNWHHLTLVYDKAVTYNLIIYSDGKIIEYAKLNANANSTSLNPGPLCLGNNGFTGVVDDVTIYKKALSYSDIISISEASPDVTANELKKVNVLDINANGNLLDYSDNYNHAIQMDGIVPAFVTSKTEPQGKAIQFNGQNYLQVANSPSINLGAGDFSISCWFKTTNTANINTILDKRINVGSGWQGYHLCVYGGTDILLQMADDVRGWCNYRGPSGTKLNDGNWHFATVTVDRDNTQGVKFYIDGQLKYSDNATYRTGSLDTSANLLIGKHIDDPANNFIGAIDGVKIYKKSLTAAEVQKVYGKKKWNMLLFLNGDNNLESQQLVKLNDCEITGSTDDVNFLVVLDRIEGEDTQPNEKDWTGTRLYYVTKDPDSSYFTCSQLLKDYGELDMSNPNNLENFITYCQTNYPAEKTLVSIANHGDGLRGISQDETSKGYVMTIAEAKQALTNARLKTKQKIDILYFDACLMQMAEIAYQFRNEADYIVGTEEMAFGWTLEEKDFYAEFVKNASKSPEDITKLFSQFSGEWTFSAIKTKDGAMTNFVTALNNFSTLLAAKTDLTDIKAAYASTINMAGNNCYIDLINFADNVAAKTTDTNLKNSAAALKTAFNSCVVFNKTYGSYLGKANGLTIFFPTSKNTLSFYEQYFGYTDTGYDLLSSTKWNEFLHVYYP